MLFRSTYGYNVDTIGPSDTIGLTQLLQRIVGKDLAVIIRVSKLIPPDVRQIDSAADFLQANKVLPVVVAMNVVTPVYVRVKFVAGKVKLPLTVKPMLAPAKVIAPSRPLIVMSLQTRGEVAIVTVNAPVPTFELASKNTLSDNVGAEPETGPPELPTRQFPAVDQLVLTPP